MDVAIRRDGKSWTVTIKDNRTKTGTYLQNAQGLVKVPDFRETAIRHMDRLLLGRFEYEGVSCPGFTYQAIYEVHIPSLPPPPLPSSLKAIPHHFTKQYQDIDKSKVVKGLVPPAS